MAYDAAGQQGTGQHEMRLAGLKKRKTDVRSVTRANLTALLQSFRQIWPRQASAFAHTSAFLNKESKHAHHQSQSGYPRTAGGPEACGRYHAGYPAPHAGPRSGHARRAPFRPSKARLVRSRGLHRHTLYFHLKDLVFRFNQRQEEMYQTFLKMFKVQPLCQSWTNAFYAGIAEKNLRWGDVASGALSAPQICTGSLLVPARKS